MDTKHTSGPWHAKAGLTQMCDPDATTVARCSPHGNEGAFWWIFSPAETHGDAEADARLIAAAPELLAALQRLMGGTTDFKDAMLANEQAKAAIARATGAA